MRLPRFVLALATTLLFITAAPLAACQTLPTSTPTTQVIDLNAARALYVGEVAYQGWTISAEAALSSGALTPAQRQQVRDIDSRAYAALTLLRQGRSTLQSVLVTIAEAQGLVTVITRSAPS